MVKKLFQRELCEKHFTVPINFITDIQDSNIFDSLL